MGETISQYSFVGDDNKTTNKGAVVDMNDMSSQNFINNNFINKRPLLLLSMVKLFPCQSYDFKRLGATKNSVTSQHMYIGMPFDGKIASEEILELYQMLRLLAGMVLLLIRHNFF